MTSPNLDPYRQSWSAYGYQRTPAATAQPAYRYPENTHAHYGHYTPSPGSSIRPHYSRENSTPTIAELPAPLPPAPQTSTSEEQLKQDELLARRMSQLEVGDAGRNSMSAMPSSPQHLMPSLHQQRSAQSLRPHSRSVSSFPDQRPASIAPLSTHNLAPMPLTHHRSAQSLRPHSRSVGSNAEPWSPGFFGRPQQQDPAIFSTLPEVVVEPVPLPYSEPKFASENLPIPVLLDQQTVRRPSIALEPSSLPLYLEQFRQAPYPPQWNPPHVLRTLYAGRINELASGTSWLDPTTASTWNTTRSSDEASVAVLPEYSFKFKSTGRSFRSPKFSWTMSCPKQRSDPSTKGNKNETNTWTYELKLDSASNLRKSEVLTQGGPKSRPILTTYVHALNYDSLRFISPDGRAYMWVSSTKVSSIGGLRYDTLRHGLFVAAGNNPNPLYGHIVADHCFWDGGGNQDGADLPDEALYIRSPSVDPALVVATLQIMKDWEKHTLREEKRRNPKAFSATEEAARNCALGSISYWRA